MIYTTYKLPQQNKQEQEKLNDNIVVIFPKTDTCRRIIECGKEIVHIKFSNWCSEALIEDCICKKQIEKFFSLMINMACIKIGTLELKGCMTKKAGRTF